MMMTNTSHPMNIKLRTMGMIILTMYQPNIMRVTPEVMMMVLNCTPHLYLVTMAMTNTQDATAQPNKQHRSGLPNRNPNQHIK